MNRESRRTESNHRTTKPWAMLRHLFFWRRRKSKGGGWHARRSKGLAGRIFAPLAWISQLLKVLWLGVRGVIRQCARFWRRRQGRHLIQGIPALLGVIAVIASVVMVDLRAPGLAEAYETAANRSLRSEDYDAAVIFLERLASFDAKRQEVQFSLAGALAKVGDEERALRILIRLAADGPSGYAEAHLALANRILTDPESYQSDEKLRRALNHLLSAQQIKPTSAEVALRISQYYVAVNRPRQAIDPLRLAAEKMPHLWFDLSLMYSAVGEMSKAQGAASHAETYYEQRLIDDPQNQDDRLRLASIKTNLRKFDDALVVLNEGATRSNNVVFKKAMATTLVKKFDHFPSASGNDAIVLLEQLRRAIEMDIDCTDAYLRLIAFGEGDRATSQRVDAFLEQLLVGPGGHAFVHFVIGSRAWMNENPESAIWHLERAFKLDDRFGAIANNLAWILSNLETPDLERSLGIIDTVIEKWPNTAVFLDTRGQILVKMERWEEALDDLEASLVEMSENIDTQRALAKVYGALGKVSLAEKHTKVANLLSERGQSSP